MRQAARQRVARVRRVAMQRGGVRGVARQRVAGCDGSECGVLDAREISKRATDRNATHRTKVQQGGVRRIGNQQAGRPCDRAESDRPEGATSRSPTRRRATGRTNPTGRGAISAPAGAGALHGRRQRAARGCDWPHPRAASRTKVRKWASNSLLRALSLSARARARTRTHNEFFQKNRIFD